MIKLIINGTTYAEKNNLLYSMLYLGQKNGLA